MDNQHIANYTITRYSTNTYKKVHTMVKLTIHKPSDKQVGGVRVSEYVFKKLEALATKKQVSKQTIIRAILEQFIDEVEL